jgi:branched-subunit amino acid transport protein
MNYTKILTAIAVMAVVTYLPRMLPLAIFKKRISNRFIRSFLAYVPYAVLAAMTFPEILYSTGNLVSAAIGLLVALLLAYFNRGLLTVALASTAAVFLTEQLLRLIPGG